MTGFGTARATCSSGSGPLTLEVEARSVNARFLELKIRHPFRNADEQAMRKRIRKRIGRGRVEVTVGLRRATDPAPAAEGADGAAPTAADAALEVLGLDAARLDALVAAAAAVVAHARPTLEVSPLNLSELLRLVPHLDKTANTAVQAPDALGETIDAAIDGLLAFRATEGAALTTVLGGLVDELEARLASLAGTLEPEAERLAARVAERVASLAQRLGAEAPLDAERVAQEVALVVARGDVTEELDRLASHIAQARQVLAENPSPGQGRTLEFLAQELFREITTIGSKITSHDGSRIVIDTKGTIERIREQVANVE